MTRLTPENLAHRRDVATAAVRSAIQGPSPLLPPGRTRPQAGPIHAHGDDLAAAARTIIETAYPGETILSNSNDAPGSASYWLAGAFESRPGNGFPAFGPAVGGILDGNVVVCAVQVPTFDETFSAATGLGATLNGRALRVAERHSFDRALILSTHFDVTTPGIGEVVTRLGGWRMPAPHAGPLALLCYLATGRLDGFVTRSLPGSAELAAGALLVQEAGGLATTRESKDGPLIAAAAHSELLEMMLARLNLDAA
jgi:myo-inositol-1(or 4)-monophosphatase